MCYWPPKNASGMAKTSQIPDKRLWKRYQIRIISSTGEKLNKDIVMEVHYIYILKMNIV